MIIETLQSDPVIREQLAAMVHAVQAEEGSLLLQLEEGMTFAVCHSPVADQLQGRVLGSGRGIVGCCFSFQQPMAVNEVQGDPVHDLSVDAATGTITRSEAVVPVSNDHAELGCLTAINSHRQNGFTPDDLQCMNQAAQSLCARISELTEGAA